MPVPPFQPVASTSARSLSLSSPRALVTSTTGVYRRLTPLPTTVVILCESWPGWLFTCGALQLPCSHVFSWTMASTWATQLSLHFLAIHFHFDTTSLPSIAPSSLILAQGSLPWFERLVPGFPPHNPVVFSASLSYSGGATLPPSGFSQFCFSSTDAGSVIDASWLFCSRGFPTPLPPSAYQRTLRHILNASARCDLCRPCRGNAQDYAALLRTSLPVDVVLAWQYAPSVFVPSGWVKRPLSASELALAFDVPTSYLPCFDNIPRHLLPWLLHAPVKLLLHVGGWLDLR
jgi:hypothetical protein